MSTPWSLCFSRRQTEVAAATPGFLLFLHCAVGWAGGARRASRLTPHAQKKKKKNKTQLKSRTSNYFCCLFPHSNTDELLPLRALLVLGFFFLDGWEVHLAPHSSRLGRGKECI